MVSPNIQTIFQYHWIAYQTDILYILKDIKATTIINHYTDLKKN